jgi:long-chain fatty acid transport protein
VEHAKRHRLLLAACLLAAPAAARGAAFQLREGDPDWLANAFAGDAAKAYDAGTAWTNPAGMVLIQGNEIDQAVNYFDPGIRFSGTDYVHARPVSGSDGGDAGPPAVTAGSESVVSLSPDLKLGLSVEAPFGLRTSYPSNFTGRYQSLVSAIEDFQVALALAYRVSPQLSIGGGPIGSYFRARLTQDINTSIYSRTFADTPLDVRGDDYKPGYYLGALYQFTPSFRVGVEYRSRIGYDVTGKQQATVPAAIQKVPFIANILNALNSDVSTQIVVPDVATISAYYDVTPQIALLATAEWTDWSLIKTLTVYAPSGPEATPVNFRNTWMGALGANYKPEFIPGLTLQLGVLYDEGANTDITRGPRLPDEDRIGAAGGLRYAITPRVEFRISYLHEFPGFGGDKIDYTNNFPNAGRLIGTYANNADVVSSGIAVKF